MIVDQTTARVTHPDAYEVRADVTPEAVEQPMLWDHQRPPEEIVSEALEVEGPVVRTYCLFSGGGDSITVAHRCHDLYDELAFIDTGTALPGVRDFVVRVADELGKPLTTLDNGPIPYEKLVLGDVAWWRWYGIMRQRWQRKGYPEHALDVPTMVRLDALRGRSVGDGKGNSPQGFPGPAGGHRAAYARLKERQVEALVRVTKAQHAPGDRFARVALLSGARIDESDRRARNQAGPGYRRKGGQVWINPLNEWTNAEMRRYRREHRIAISDVAALLHRSGECNCGAYISKGEREDLLALYGDWYADTIAPLERWARYLGIPRDRWGERADTGRPGARGTAAPVGELCRACPTEQAQLDLELAVAA
jgi:3'-phosphoadenosine 5'-phosphosulfate sulfotransferase (PAPS reductase)/FAD synthetase